MSSPFAGAGAVLNHRPVKATIEIYPDQDIVTEFPVPAGAEQWPAGATAECRFYATAEDNAPVLLTVAVDVHAEMLRMRIEFSQLSPLAMRAVFAIYVSLPDSPTADYIAVTGPTVRKKKG